MKTKTEKYLFKSDKSFFKKPHTDTLCEMEDEFYQQNENNLELIFSQKMDETEYNQTILANSCVKFSDIFAENEIIQVDVFCAINSFFTDGENEYLDLNN